MKENKYYIYVLRCEDNSLYTGIAKDYQDRYKKHIAGTGAKYTKIKKPIKIEKVWWIDGRSAASKIEYFIKKQARTKKEQYIAKNDLLKNEVMKKLEIEVYEI